VKRHFLFVISCLACLSSFLVVPTTAPAQDRPAAAGPDRIRTLLLRPAGWNVDWTGPSGDSTGKVTFTYEAREDRVLVRIQQLFRSDGGSVPNCERAVTITPNGVTHDGCMDFSIELVFDPADQEYPFKGKSPRGYRYRLKAG
jgi:hypothetical protein